MTWQRKKKENHRRESEIIVKQEILFLTQGTCKLCANTSPSTYFFSLVEKFLLFFLFNSAISNMIVAPLLFYSTSSRKTLKK